MTTTRTVRTDERRNGAVGITVRPFDERDYADVVAIANRVYPDYPETVDEWRHWDAHRSEKMKHARFVAEVDGRIAGFAHYNQWEGMYHPQKFGIDVQVDPDVRGQGIGATLYAHLLDALTPFDPITLWASAREDFAYGVGFLTDRGFTEVMRQWESHLDLMAFDPAAWTDRVTRVADTGVRFATFGELASDPDRYRKLFEMVDAIAEDVPSPGEHTSPDFEGWVERIESSPNLLPDLYFVALDGDRYVGLSNMWASQASDDEVYTGLTGTLREYRRRGIATALKVTAISAAKAQGYVKTKTWNETGNEGMLAINVMLGFERQPAWIDYAKALAEAD